MKELCVDIENILLREVNPLDDAKENIPFICVINPPRHGKSLLLNSLFHEQEEAMVVIPITYNSNIFF